MKDDTHRAQKSHSWAPFRRVVFLGTLAGLAVGAASAVLAVDASPAPADTNVFREAGFAELVYHVQRYGNTPERKAAKDAASSELDRRGTNSLHYLMGVVHVENVMVQVYTEHLVATLTPEEAAPSLVAYLDSERGRTRRLAAYWLGLHDTPQYVDKVLARLGDDEACGAAIRTLGKWRVASAIDRVAPFVKDPKEPRRVVAVNALGDMDDPRAVPALLRALDDPVFTVREAAQAALQRLGQKAATEVLTAAEEAEGTRLRHLVKVIGSMSSWRAERALKRFARSSDPEVRADAQEALRICGQKQP